MDLQALSKMTFRDQKDPILYFLVKDSLYNLGHVCASLLNNYHCGAGCSMCYVKDQWLPLSDFKSRSSDITPEILLKRYQSLSKHFNYIELMDDPVLIQKMFPAIYESFKSISKEFISPSISNNNILRFAKAIKDIEYKAIDQISVSDLYLLKNTDRIFRGLEMIKEQYGTVNSIRVIAEGTQLSNDLRIPELIRRLRPYAESVNYVGNILLDDGTSDDKGGAEAEALLDVIEDGIYAESDVVHLIYENTLHSAGDNLYMRTEEVIDPLKADPVCSIHADAETILASALKRKLALYEESAKLIQNKNTKHFEYYQSVKDRIKVNDYFNFIPSMMINWNFKIFDVLMAEGWQRIPQGLYKPTVDGSVAGIINRS